MLEILFCVVLFGSTFVLWMVLEHRRREARELARDALRQREYLEASKAVRKLGLDAESQKIKPITLGCPTCNLHKGHRVDCPRHGDDHE